jgi:hypothetical protein
VPNVPFAAPFAHSGVEDTIARDGPCANFRGVKLMLTIAVILLALWLLGLVSSYTVGGLIHLLLVVAVVIFLVRVIQGRRPIA